MYPKELLNARRHVAQIASKNSWTSLSMFLGRSLRAQMCRDTEHEENWTEDTCEGGRSSKPRSEKKDWRLWCGNARRETAGSWTNTAKIWVLC